MKQAFHNVSAGSSNYTRHHHIIDKYMKLYKLTMFFIITIIISANIFVISGQTLSLSTSDSELEKQAISENLAESLIERAQDAKENLETAFEDIEDEGNEIPSVSNSNYLKGIELLSQSKDHFLEKNYTGASEIALQAIQAFGNSYKQIQVLTTADSNEEVEDETKDNMDGETSDPRRLAIAIERAFNYLDKLKQKVNRFGEEGFDVTNIEYALNNVNNFLNLATDYQKEGDHSAAVQNFSSARTLLGRIHGFIESKINERQEKQAERFLLQVQSRVQKITGVLEGLQVSLDAGKIQRTRIVLNYTTQKLLMLKNSLTTRNLEEIIDDVETAVDELEDGLDELDGNGFSNQIKSTYRYEAIVESFNETLQRYSDSGYNTSGLNKYLNNAQDFLARIQTEFRTGNKEAAEELIEEAGKFLEEAHENFRDFQKSETTSKEEDETIIDRPESSDSNGINHQNKNEKSDTASLRP